MRILVCGGRDYTDWETLHDWLYEYSKEHFDWPIEGPTIISGMAKGADTIAAKWAKDNWLTLIEFPADWDKYGKKAGPIRNQQMIDEGKPDLVVAFPTPKSKGTWDMIRRAEKAGIPVKIIK